MKYRLTILTLEGETYLSYFDSKENAETAVTTIFKSELLEFHGTNGVSVYIPLARITKTMIEVQNE